MQQAQGQQIFNVIGMMSGTSEDGVDLSLCCYRCFKDQWKYELLGCKTYPYRQEQIKMIRKMEEQACSLLEYRSMEIQYSSAIAAMIKDFIASLSDKIQKSCIDYLCLHGHTIHHRPSQGITIQALNLPFVAAKLEMNVIGNFRQLDVHCGGEGAPLVPFGQQLFGNSVFLNLGGIANIGYKGQGTDIGFCNLVFNSLSRLITGAPFDEDGRIGEKGHILPDYLQQLQNRFPSTLGASLAREQVEDYIHSLTTCNNNINLLTDIARTYYQFLARRIISAAEEFTKQLMAEQTVEVVCTGGGSYNKFLLKLLNENSKHLAFRLPAKEVIEFKQSIIFGLLGLKFVQNQQNCKNGIGGQLIKGKRY